MPKKPTRLEIRANGQIIYLNDVAEYRLAFDGSDLELTASHTLKPVADSGVPGLTGTPLVPPPLTPGAPDGDDEGTAPPVEVIERVHTGDRKSKKSEADKLEERRAAVTEAVADGVLSPNEVREAEGLPPVEGGTGATGGAGGSTGE